MQKNDAKREPGGLRTASPRPGQAGQDKAQERRSKLADAGAADEQGGDEQKPEEHEGGIETQVSDRTGPGAGYDDEPKQVKDEGGVS